MKAAEQELTLNQEIIGICDNYIKKYQMAVEAFKNAMTDDDVMYAVEYRSQEVATASEPYITATKIKEAVENGTATPEGILKWRDELRKQFTGSRTARSTNPIGNELENLRHESRTRMLFDNWNGIYSEIEDAIKGNYILDSLE